MELIPTNKECCEQLEIVNIIATDKVHRLIRQLVVIVEKQHKYRPSEIEDCKKILNLDKQEIIGQYKNIVLLVKRIKHKKIKYHREKSDVAKCLEASAYENSARVIKEKLEIQVKQWIENKDVMIFETLTVAPENLNPKIIKTLIQKYKRKLRKNGCKYLLVFELGSKHGRPHFHVIYNKSHKLGIESHGNWQGGSKLVLRVKYLNDGFTKPMECILNGWNQAAIVGYMVKYIAKDITEKRENREYKYRTQMSRGFGTWKLRKIIMKTSTSQLKKMVLEGMNLYKTIMSKEIQKELTRRIEIPMAVLRRTSQSPKSTAIRAELGCPERSIGSIPNSSRQSYEGFDNYRAN